MTAALSSVYRVLQQQAAMLSINDAFFITMVTTIIGVFVVLIFVRDPVKKNSPARKKQSTEAGSTIEEEEESAEPVFMH
jgi:cellobiose-specific phosphotransferase system component IIC